MKVPFRRRQQYLGHLAFYYTRAADAAVVDLAVADATEATLDRVVPGGDNE